MTLLSELGRRKRLLAALVAAPLLAGGSFALAQGAGAPATAPAATAPAPAGDAAAPPPPAPGGAMAQADAPPPPPPPGEDSPRRGPRHGHGHDHGPGRGGPEKADLDEAAMQAAVEAAGYTAVALVDTGPRHGEFTGTDAANRVWLIHVDEDNEIRERSPFAAAMTPEALGYTDVGGFEAKRRHVQVEARNDQGRLVIVELNADGSLNKERYPR